MDKIDRKGIDTNLMNHSDYFPLDSRQENTRLTIDSSRNRALMWLPRKKGLAESYGNAFVPTNSRQQILQFKRSITSAYMLETAAWTKKFSKGSFEHGATEVTTIELNIFSD